MNVLNGLRGIVRKFLGSSVMNGSSIWSWALPGSWSKGDLLKQNVGYVYTVVAAIAQEAAKASFVMDRKSTTGIIPVLNHPFLRLLAKPNPEESQFQFLEMHFTYMKLIGESYWYLVRGENSRQIKEMYILRPDLVEVIPDETSKVGAVKGYMFTPTRQTFDTTEIRHFKMPNPSDKYHGLGPTQAGKVYIETESYTAKWTRNSIYNSGRPSGVLTIKGNIENDQFEKLKRQWKQEYSGTQNAGKTLLLKSKDGTDFTKLGMELGEVAMKELKDMSRDDIMLMFRVSKTILGITDDVNRANAHEARAVFTENVIKPELDRLLDQLNAFVIPEYGVDYELRYVDPTMKSDKDKLEEWTAGVGKWLTVNDIRLERNLKPVPGGDVFYQPINMVPVTQPAQKKLKKKALGENRIEIYHKMFFDNQELWERRYLQEMKKEFALEEAEILDNHKSLSKKKQVFVEWLFNAEAAKSRLVSAFLPMGIELMKESAKFAFDIADDPERELELTDRLREYIRDRVDRFATDTGDETVAAIDETIAEGVRKGESVAKLRKRIQEVYEQADKVRATRIARTETLAVSNEAANEAYRQSPMVTGKEWSVEIDACPFCQQFAGKVIGLNEEFVKVGDTVKDDDGHELHVDYENVQHPPLHSNCRCALLPVATR